MNTEKSENIGIKEIKFSSDRYENTEADVLILALTQEGLEEIRKNGTNEISKILKTTFFKSELCETDLVPNTVDNKPRSMLFLGLGKEDELDLEKVRKAHASAISLLKFSNVTNFAVTVPELKFEEGDVIKAITEGLLLGDYKFDKYKTLEPKAKEIKTLILLADEKYKKLVTEAKIVCDNVNLVREWVNESGSIEHPDELVEMSKQIAQKNSIKFTVLNKKELKDAGMNLICAVGQGSKYEPHIIIMEYNGSPDSEEKIAIVGKGITFDTGGLNLKTENHMQDMRTDMAGAATVLGTIKAAAELGIRKNIIAVIGTAENMIGPDAYKPGDILKSYKGITVEVANTDAEGRLVLADTLAYTVKNYNPSEIIDLATLTGAVVSALGVHTIGMFGNSDKLIQLLETSGHKVYERVWRFPMFQEYKDDIKSEVADIKNLGPKGQAGSISGAVFLEPFVENTKWAHLDIAGVAFLDRQIGYIPKGGTGTGLRLLIEFLSNN